MKIKNVKLSLIVLFTLVISSFTFFVSAQEQATTTKNIFLDSDQDGLSDAEEKTLSTDPFNADTDGDGYSDGAEIKSGYDPLKKAPGDKIIPDADMPTSTATADPNQPNMTAALAQKISTAIDAAGTNNQEVNLDQVQSMVTDATNTQVTPDELPQISPKDIKIKKQNYKNLSKDKADAQKKDDFTTYIAGLSYIASSNSPTPITSNTDINGVTSSLLSQLVGAITSGNLSSAKGLSTSGEKILQQMKDLEVPEELVDMHIKGLQLATYAIGMQDKIAPNQDDPVMAITNYSKMQSLIDLVVTYSSDVQAQCSKYGLTYDSSVQNKLKDYGVTVPLGLLQGLSE